MRRVVVLALPRSFASFCLIALFTVAPAGATTFVPMSIADLTRSSTAVVRGTVREVESVESETGGIGRRVRIAVDTVVAGAVSGPVLVLEELGGRLDGRTEVVFGAPSYSAGEQVLVFVRTGRGGTLHTSQLALGKFRIEGSLALRTLGSGTSVAVSPSSSAWRPTIPLAELIAEIDAAGSTPASAPLPRPSTLRQAQGERDVFATTIPRAGFELFDPAARFFEVDEGREISFLIDPRGDDILGFDAARQAVDEGFAAWTNVDSARIVLSDGGLIADLSKPCTPGLHKIRFNDPDDEIPDPVNCSGVLGVGGYCSTDGELKSFGGVTFQKAVRALVTFADNWGECEEWNPCNVAEVATHEIGHAIGFDHSSEDPNETEPQLEDATMYFMTHFDGRCAGLRSDDIAAVTFVYPLDTVPTITSGGTLPVGVAGEAYQFTLAATGGAGSFQWETTSPCQGFPGLELTSAGVLQGTPTAFGSGCFTIKATDTDGDSHTKRFDIEVSLDAATPTNTSVAATATPTPIAATPTRTRTFAPVQECIGDCDGDRSVGLDELIRSVRIALGLDQLDGCSEVDADGDGRVTIDELVAAVVAVKAGCAPA